MSWSPPYARVERQRRWPGLPRSWRGWSTRIPMMTSLRVRQSHVYIILYCYHRWTLFIGMFICMYYPAHFHLRVHIGRKARHNEQVNYTQDSSFFQKSCPVGVIRTHYTLLSRRALNVPTICVLHISLFFKDSTHICTYYSIHST